MKKYIATLVALIMIFFVFTIVSPVSVFAEEDDGYDFSANVPDDAFDGKYTDFKGNDDSVTRVFDNGSVSTKNKDGSVTAVDYKGNQYSEDKDGNSSVRTTDGYVATEYKDGRQSLTEPNGKTTTFNTDGSFTESFNSLGVSVDYDTNGRCVGVGFTESDERIGTDEGGAYLNGEVIGPNGATMKVTDEGMSLVTPGGTKAEYSYKGFSDSNGGRVETMNVTWANGASVSSTLTTTANRDKNGIFTGNTLFGEGSFTAPTGDQWDYAMEAGYDKDGKPTSLDNNVTQFTSSDGCTLWRDLNTEAWEFRDPATGDKIVVDQNGNLTEYKDGVGNNWNVSYDEDGNVTSADITYPDGAKFVRNPDGSGTFTLPDGTKYESDDKGNLTKDGVPIKNDGQWVQNRRDETKPDDIVGYWQLKETNVTPCEDEIGTDAYASWYYSASELSHSTRVSRPKTDYHGAGSATMFVSCSAPPQIIRSDEDVIMHLSVELSCEGDYLLWSIYGAVGYGKPNDERNGIMYNDPTRFAATEDGAENRVYLDTIGNTPCPEATVHHVFGKGVPKRRRNGNPILFRRRIYTVDL